MKTSSLFLAAMLFLSGCSALPPAQSSSGDATPAANPSGTAKISRNITFARWHQGSPPTRLIRSDEGFCFLTAVGGHFQGGGESVRVYVGDDGYWYLGGQSMQQGVWAECGIIRYGD